MVIPKEQDSLAAPRLDFCLASALEIFRGDGKCSLFFCFLNMNMENTIGE
jgi:hypothetical protein